MKQNLDLVKDKSIGIGLSCSKDIALQLGGDLNINFSRKNLTSFTFNIPVILSDQQANIRDADMNHLRLERKLGLDVISSSEQLEKYLNQKGIDSLINFEIDMSPKKK